MWQHATHAGAQQLAPPADRAAPQKTVLTVAVAVPDDAGGAGRLHFTARGVIGGLFALLVGLSFITTAQAAQSQTHGSVELIDIVSPGIYEPMNGPLPKGVPAYTVDDVQLIAVTSSIPAKLGINFGFRFRIVGDPIGAPVAIKTVIIFPSGGVVSPTDGLVHSVSHVDMERIGAVKALACKINEPWLMVPGKWTIQLWVGGQKFAEQSFHLIPQQPATDQMRLGAVVTPAPSLSN